MGYRMPPKGDNFVPHRLLQAPLPPKGYLSHKFGATGWPLNLFWPAYRTGRCRLCLPANDLRRENRPNGADLRHSTTRGL